MACRNSDALARSLAAGALLLVSSLPSPAAEPPTFADVAPLLASRCVMCHTGDGAPLALRLDSYAGLMKGSQKQPVVKPGDPAASELVKRIKGQSQPRMPLVGDPLAAAEIALVERWIKAGAVEGRPVAAPAPAPARPKPGEAVTWTHVAPIFLQRCAKCHKDSGIMGAPPEGYRLDSLEALLSPLDRVRVVPGNPRASELVRRIRGQSLPRMPFDGPPYLPDDDIALVEEWIAQGAKDANGKPAPIPAGAPVRLEGKLTGQWVLDGLPLKVDGGTRIDKGPRTGDQVQVRGVVGPDGSIRVERLRKR